MPGLFTFPEWAQVTVYKIMGGQRVAFVGPKVYFKEIFSGEKGLRVPNSRWRQAPIQMLEKCAEAARSAVHSPKSSATNTRRGNGREDVRRRSDRRRSPTLRR
jgi:hypothetical protein